MNCLIKCKMVPVIVTCDCLLASSFCADRCIHILFHNNKKRKSVEHFDPFLFIGESEVTDHEVTVLSVSKICGSSKFIT